MTSLVRWRDFSIEDNAKDYNIFPEKIQLKVYNS